MKVEVFGMTNCAGCETVKAVLKQQGVEYHYYDVMHHADMEQAQKHNVRSVPTTVITHSEGVDVHVGGSKETVDLIKFAVGA
jgi:glutaredoxin